MAWLLSPTALAAAVVFRMVVVLGAAATGRCTCLLAALPPCSTQRTHATCVRLTPAVATADAAAVRSSRCDYCCFDGTGGRTRLVALAASQKHVSVQRVQVYVLMPNACCTC